MEWAFFSTPMLQSAAVHPRQSTLGDLAVANQWTIGDNQWTSIKLGTQKAPSRRSKHEKRGALRTLGAQLGRGQTREISTKDS